MTVVEKHKIPFFLSNTRPHKLKLHSPLIKRATLQLKTAFFIRQAPYERNPFKHSFKCWLNVLFKNSPTGFTKEGLINSSSLDPKALHQPKEHKGCLKKELLCMQRDGQISADDWAAHFERIFQTALLKHCIKIHLKSLTSPCGKSVCLTAKLYK